MIGAVNAACYDISAACTGFVFALNTAHAFISSGLSKTALVIGSDVLSKLTDWIDRNTCVLFGDGAGAVVVKADSTGILGMNMHSDGTKGGVLTCGSRTNGNFLMGKKPELGYMTMDGQEVFKFAVKKVPEIIEQVTEEAGVSLEDVRLVHSAPGQLPDFRIHSQAAEGLHGPDPHEHRILRQHVGGYGSRAVRRDEPAGETEKRRSAGAGRLRRRPDLGSHAVYMADGIVKALPVFRRLSIYGGAQRFRNKK